MKPTDKQKEFIAELRKVLEENFTDWNGSNDITSPSHFTLIEESLEGLKEKFPEELEIRVEIFKAIHSIYSTLREIK